MGLIYSDIPELVGTDTEVVLKNLGELEKILDGIIQARLAHIFELSSAVVNDGEDIDLIKSIVLSMKSEDYADSDAIIEENRKNIYAVYSHLSLVERLMLCRGISERIFSGRRAASELFSPEAQEQIPSSATDRIAYLKSSYNDSVYIKFASLLSSPRAAYFDSIAEVCRSVYDRECEYCFLPVETSENGKLPSFYGMIIKYGFYICSVCEVSDAVGVRTRYALLKKKSNMRGNVIRSKSRIKMLEFAVNIEEYPSVSDILTAAELCSMNLRRVDTLGDSLICPVFRIDGADIDTFLTFMAIDSPSFSLLGIYTQI